MGTTAEKLQDVIDETRRDLGRKAESIVRAAREMQHNLDRVVASVEAGQHVNSCGEIQGRGASFDILCAQYEDLAQHIAALEWAAKAAD